MAYVLVYIAAITAANLSVAQWGPWVSPINAFLLIGLDLALRDTLHDRWKGDRLVLRMGALIAAAGVVSYALNPASGMIAIASVVAFSAGALVDAGIYHWLRDKPYLMRSNASNSGGAVADSFLFPTIAFGAFLPAIVALQIVAKIGGGFLWSLLLNRVAAKA
jgi:hypothetical protein